MNRKQILKEIEICLEKAKEIQKKAQSWYDKANKLDDILDKIDSEKVKKKCSLKYIMNLNYRYLKEKHYDEVHKWIKKQKYFERGVYFSGYNPHTNQILPSIKLDKAKPIEKQNAILEVLPLIKKVNNEYKYVDIFEKDLNEHGHYYLFIYDKHIILMLTKNYISYQLKKFKDINEALDYIKENLFYTDSSTSTKGY